MPIPTTGDTVLNDGDGGGTFSFAPVLMKKNETGEYEDFTLPCNIFYRIFDTVYPGDRDELWITFEPYPGYQATKRRLDPGDYRIRLECVVRNEIDAPDWMRTIWSGEPFCTAYFDFTVEDEPRQTGAGSYFAPRSRRTLCATAGCTPTRNFRPVLIPG